MPKSSAFWNYVIPDGSTTDDLRVGDGAVFWNYVIPDGSTTKAKREGKI